MRIRFLIAGCCLVAVSARADWAGYGGVHEVVGTNGTITARHVHDWSSKKLPDLFLDLAHHNRFFSAANDFAFIEVRNKAGKLLFKSPAPALTKLWVSPDSLFIVGLSDVMLYNPYQLVVWRSNGTLIHCEHISARVAKLSPPEKEAFFKRFPSARRVLQNRYAVRNGVGYLDFSILGVPNEISGAAWDYLYKREIPHPYSNDFEESVTNNVDWFDSRRPDIRTNRDGNELFLSLRSPRGHRMNIPITEK